MKIKTNSFAHRHTAESEYGYFEGTFEELEALVTKHYHEAKPGYRDGVCLVPVPPERFRSSIMPVTDKTPLRAKFAPRREGEAPFLQVVSDGPGKCVAGSCNIVLYRKDVLDEGNEATFEDSDWEIVSINPEPGTEESPMDPVTMARNFLQMEGGTKGDFSAEDFAKAIIFHATHVKQG